MRKVADKMFETLGFKSDPDNTDDVCSYSRYVQKQNYTHRIEIIRKIHGPHLCISYEERVNNEKFNNAVGMSFRMMLAARRKMREMGLITFFGKDIH